MLTLENYSLNSGLKYSKPIIHEVFYPITASKYIIIETTDKKEEGISKSTIWSQIAIDLDSVLAKQNSDIKILLLSPQGYGIDETKNIISLNRKSITFKQLAYIIKNSLLYCGEKDDSIMLASIFEKKIVQVSSFVSSSKPFWSDSKDYISIDSEDINTPIYPEIITNSILDKLNLNKLKNHKTIYIGSNYISPIILESTPDMVCTNVAVNMPLHIRYDFVKSFSEEDIRNTISNLQGRKCAIITNKNIPIESFYPLKDNIIYIVYDVTESLDIDFLKKANFVSSNIKLIFLKKSPLDDPIIEKRKFDLIDTHYILEIIDMSNKKVADIDFKSNASYKSKKILLSKNKVFYSKAAMLSGKPIQSASENVYQKISEISPKYRDDFLKEEIDFCYLSLT
jgi:hypothetical protein